MKNNQNLKSTKSAVKVGTSIIVTILILLLVFLMNLSYQVIGYSPNTANGTSFTYRTLRSNRNILCSSKNKHLSNYTWYLANRKQYEESNTAKAYLFAYATKYGRGTGTDQYYGDHIQQAYWRMCNPNTGKANAIYKRAQAFENYRKNYKGLKVTAARKSSNSISVTISGNHNDTYGFGKIDSVTVYDRNGNEIKRGSNTYGTQTITGLGNYDSVTVKVTYKNLTATATYSTYTTKRNGKTGQPIVIFTGSFSGDGNGTPVETSTTVFLKTDVSLQKYITKVNGNNLTNTETSLTDRKNKKTATNETNANVKNAISKNDTATNTYKRNNVVKIELNDIVTYQITVYNNSNATASNIIVKDVLPYTTNSNGAIKSLATFEECLSR